MKHRQQLPRVEALRDAEPDAERVQQEEVGT